MNGRLVGRWKIGAFLLGWGRRGRMAVDSYETVRVLPERLLCINWQKVAAGLGVLGEEEAR